ncbi:MAG: ABC transporter ATP-binding protein [Verrucomicrobiales bacterium]|nr:ABC transporter ATP-binding protein [Verrucomicrobiales bacterium]
MLSCSQLSRKFRTRQGSVTAIEDVSLALAKGSFTCVRGPSGCGKTTLLLALGGMLRPSNGRVLLEEADLYALSPAERSRRRAGRIGFVFQMFHLVPYLNVLENVLLAGANGGGEDALARATTLLRELGLGDRLRHRPSQLSAGERQRTALARALLNRPAVVLADEPTGNLDPDNAREVFGHLDRFRRDGGTVLVVTHGDTAREFADQELHMDKGRLLPKT